MDSSDFSSFLNPNIFGEKCFEKSIKVAETETVQMVTLDHFMKNEIKNYDKKRIFLKLDTQGYDIRVFNGGSHVIPKVTALVPEISLKPIYSDMPYYLDMVSVYESSDLNLQVYFLCPELMT